MNIFMYRFKALIKNKELVFWVILFPILLVTLFNMAFSNFGEFGIINTINVRNYWRYGYAVSADNGASRT